VLLRGHGVDHNLWILLNDPFRLDMRNGHRKVGCNVSAAYLSNSGIPG
jgi:hypothetical protein